MTNDTPNSSHPEPHTGNWRGSAVRLVSVSKTFGRVAAVNNLNLEVLEGEFLTLLGPSGCGKTTTLRLIGGFEHADEGFVFIGDRDVTRHPAYHRPVSTVFQQYALFPHLTVMKNISYGLRHAGIRAQESKRRTGRIVDLMQITELVDRKPRQLSGGQQQRVALARALVMEPRVLLLDEPLASLDLKLRKAMQLELKRVQREVGVTFVYVTHDQEEAMTMSDRIVVMNGGHIEQFGSPEDVYDSPATPFVAGFVGDTNLIYGSVAEVRVDKARIHTTDLGEIWVTETDSLSVGDPGRVSIRPSDIRLVPDPEGPLQVRDATLAGSHVNVVAVTPVTSVSVLAPRADGIVVGETVSMVVDSSRARFFRERQE